MGSKRTPEGLVKSRIKKALDSLGKDRCWWYMPTMGEFGTNGVPDFVACIDGRFLGIEAKRGKATKPTTRQELRIEAIKQAGGECIVVHSANIEKFEATIQSLIHGTGSTGQTSSGSETAAT